MVFFRTKEVKGHKYLYLVENSRKDGKVIQKTLYYFGKDKPSEKEIDKVLRKLKKTKD